MNVSGGVLKFLALLLAFVIGFLACAGSLILGGMYIYKNVSYETLQSWGVPLPSTDRLLDSHADVRLTSLTLAQLVAEMQGLSGFGDRLTLELLVERYGVKLPEAVDALLPPALMEVSLQTLLSAEGISYIMDNTTVEYLFAFLPDGLLSEPVKDALRDRPLSDLMGGELAELLDDVKVGYFLDITYEKQSDGSYRIVYADAENPSLTELIAPLSMGKLLDATSGGGDVLAVVKEDLGDVLLADLIGNSVDETLVDFVENKTLDDIIVYDSQTGKCKLDVKELAEDVRLGTLMGCEPIKDDPADPDRITGWMDGSVEMTALECAVADITLKELMSDDFEITDAIGDLYLGDVMGYEKEEQLTRAAEPTPTYVWYEKELDEHGQRVPLTGLDKAIAGIRLGGVIEGEEDVITGAFSDLYLGEIMDYEKGAEHTDADGNVTYTWYEAKADGSRTALSGMDKAIANILLDDLLNNDEYDITNAFSDLYLGEVLGYEKGAEHTDADGKVTYTWYEKELDAHGRKVALSGIDEAMANILLSDLLGGDDYNVTDAFSDLYLGEIMGYEKENGADGPVWYEKELDEHGQRVPLSGIDKAIANILLDDLLNDDEYEISDAFSDLYLGEVMGYEKGDLKSEATDDAPAQYVWTEDDERVSGIKEKFSNYLLSVIMDGTADVSADDMRLYEVLDMYKKVYPAYTADGESLGTHTVWYEDEACTVRAATVFNALAEKTVATLEDDLPDLFIGYTVGMVQVEGDWYEASDVMTRDTADGVEEYVELTLAEGIMLSFADLSIDDMSDDELVRGAVNDITLADALNLTKGENGKYYDADIKAADVTYADGEYKKDGTVIEPVSGIMEQLAEKPVGSLTEEIDGIYIGDAMGWELIDEEHPRDPASWRNGGNPVKGVMASFAGLTVKQMSNEAEVQAAVKNVTLADALGYKLGEDGKYYDGTTPVEGIMAQLADKQVGSLTEEVDKIYIGEVMGWTLIDEENPTEPTSWQDAESQPAKGIMLSFAGLTVKQISDEAEVQKAVKKVTLADALGYKLGADGKYYDESDNVVTGIMSVLATEKVGDLTTRVDTMYLGEIMGWTPKWNDPDDHSQGAEYWEDAENHRAEGFMVAFAHLTVKEMTDEEAVHEVVKTLTLADAMNYTKGENDKYYVEKITDTTKYTYNEADQTYYKKGTTEAVAPIDGVLATLVDAQVGDMKGEVENTYVGEMMGWTPEWDDPDDHTAGVRWFYADGKLATGVVLPFASLTLKDMSDEGQVRETIEQVYVYDVMGYTIGADGLFYEEPVTDETQYRYTAGAYYTVATSRKVAPVSGIMAALASERISGIDARITTLRISDVFSEQERSTGFLSLIDPNTRLYASGSQKGLAEAVTETFTNAPIGQFLKNLETPAGHGAPKTAGLIELNAATVNSLNALDIHKGHGGLGAYEVDGEYYARYWQTLKIEELLEYIVASVSIEP